MNPYSARLQIDQMQTDIARWATRSAAARDARAGRPARRSDAGMLLGGLRRLEAATRRRAARA